MRLQFHVASLSAAATIAALVSIGVPAPASASVSSVSSTLTQLSVTSASGGANQIDRRPQGAVTTRTQNWVGTGSSAVTDLTVSTVCEL